MNTFQIIKEKHYKTIYAYGNIFIMLKSQK